MTDFWQSWCDSHRCWWCNPESGGSLDFQDILIVVGAFNKRLILDLEQVHIVSATKIRCTLSALLTSDNRDQSEIPPISQSMLLENNTVTLHWQRSVRLAALPPTDPDEKCSVYTSQWLPQFRGFGQIRKKILVNFSEGSVLRGILLVVVRMTKVDTHVWFRGSVVVLWLALPPRRFDPEL